MASSSGQNTKATILSNQEAKAAVAAPTADLGARAAVAAPTADLGVGFWEAARREAEQANLGREAFALLDSGADNADKIVLALARTAKLSNMKTMLISKMKQSSAEDRRQKEQVEKARDQLTEDLGRAKELIDTNQKLTEELMARETRRAREGAQQGSPKEKGEGAAVAEPQSRPPDKRVPRTPIRRKTRCSFPVCISESPDPLRSGDERAAVAAPGPEQGDESSDEESPGVQPKRMAKRPRAAILAPSTKKRPRLLAKGNAYIMRQQRGACDAVVDQGGGDGFPQPDEGGEQTCDSGWLREEDMEEYEEDTLGRSGGSEEKVNSSVHFHQLVVTADVSAEDLRRLLQQIGAGVVIVHFDQVTAKSCGGIDRERRLGLLKEVVQDLQHLKGCTCAKGYGAILWRTHIVHKIRFGPKEQDDRRWFQAIQVVPAHTWHDKRTTAFAVAVMWRTHQTMQGPKPLSTTFANNIADMIVKERARMVWGWWDCPVECVANLCRSCGATPPGVFATRYSLFAADTMTTSVAHPSMCFIVGPASPRVQEANPPMELPAWLRNLRSGLKAHEFPADDVPAWEGGGDHEETCRSRGVDTWPHLGKVKHVALKSDREVTGIHQLIINITATIRKGGKGAYDAKTKLWRERQEAKEKGWENTASAWRDWEKEKGWGNSASASSPAVAGNYWGGAWRKSDGTDKAEELEQSQWS